MSTSNTISKVGALSYIIWACLHLLAAYSVYVLVFLDAWNLLFFTIIVRRSGVRTAPGWLLCKNLEKTLSI